MSSVPACMQQTSVLGAAGVGLESMFSRLPKATARCVWPISPTVTYRPTCTSLTRVIMRLLTPYCATWYVVFCFKYEQYFHPACCIMGFAVALFVFLGTSSRGNLNWAWGGRFCLFVYAVQAFPSKPPSKLCNTVLTEWSVGQSLWTHLLASDEKVLPLCLFASVCHFDLHCLLEQRISGHHVII